MKYFIKNESNEIMSLLPELYAGISLPENYSLHEIAEEDESRLLPAEFYDANTRPKHIANISDFSFDFVPGTYHRQNKFYLTCAFVGENCFANIARVITKHYVASINSENNIALTAADLDLISISDRPQEIDNAFNENRSVKINNEDFTANFSSGVATIAIATPSFNNAMLSLEIDGEVLYAPVTFPDSLIKMHNLKASRDIKLRECDWLVTRHITQQALADCTPILNLAQYEQLIAYMQELRDFPETADLDNITWPIKPSFVA